ncbi:5-(carboxyamino)imidazole ribonucleotide synthase [Alicyclobacillaceae bacterium I2511]|nr:5-(carboxyamino)imidazole ribonucleotide synthase [Alicyclobacillaceae bacterium I2511]
MTKVTANTRIDKISVESTQTLEPNLILPGSTLGILGGGQLGRMMAMAARTLGYQISVLDPDVLAPCAALADTHVRADFHDIAGAVQLAAVCDVATYEFENVGVELAQTLADAGKLPQGTSLLAATQHRLREKQTILGAGGWVAPYWPVRTQADLTQAAAEVGLPMVVKTCHGGYDGKGQWQVKSTAGLASVWQQMVGSLPPDMQDIRGMQVWEAPFVAEQFVPFVKELSVVVARSQAGEIRTFPVAENIHQDHILRFSVVPARIADEIAVKAADLASQLATSLNLVGVLGVEMFLTAQGELWVNELAPRPHNTAHYTLDACATSQFEQHVRAVCGLPLDQAELQTPVVMANVLGEHLPLLLNHLSNWPTRMKLHLYGKAEARRGRKMGHVNVLCDTPEEGLQALHSLGIWELADLVHTTVSHNC